MMDVTALVPQEDIDGLSSVLDRLQAETGRSADDSVTYAGLKIAESGRAASKLSKTKRPNEENPQWSVWNEQAAWVREQRKQGKASLRDVRATKEMMADINRYRFKIHDQRNQGFWMYTNVRSDPRRQILSRGLAKRTWNVMAGKMGAMRQGAGNSSGKDYRVSKYTESLGDSSGSVVVRLVNTLSYLEDAYPGITATAVRKGTAALNGMLDRRIERAAERANRGR